MSERPTPETDKAVIESQGQWSFVLKETCQRLERERDKARAALDEIEKYGTEEINAAIKLRQKLADARIERDEAREALAATKHYLTKERDDALAQIVQAECRAERFCQERDEARAQLEIIKPSARELAAKFVIEPVTEEEHRKNLFVAGLRHGRAKDFLRRKEGAK